ncbi:olfactory receptor 7C1-like [Dasypus novemcinctus]|uniref:olfactory receptor 7C1-like n=1 Tax=Dasypus novemcinctus TaxID=9361 RepID=UPI00062AC539|nr:olfactory receptor 7C1-like [Dasypus novemcinctus]
METGNQTGVVNFLLLGFAEEKELQPFLFGLFLSLYLVTFIGNLLITLVIISDTHLHMPMYFFLSNLSFDFGLVSTTIPKMILSIQTQNKVISHAGCLTQIFFFFLSGCLDSFLLAVMAYDRFVAICHPLHYTVIMNPRFCVLMVLASWCVTLSMVLIQTLTVLRLSFCTNIEIPQFYCDLLEVLKLSCSDKLINNIFVGFTATVCGVPSLIGVLFSYSQIVSSILRISSARGKCKAFSTCGSHLSVVSLYYGTGFGVYLSTAVMRSSKKTLVASLMYTLATPMLNPFIYSLRNRDMKEALGRLLGWTATSQ